jgi:MFS family permease
MTAAVRKIFQAVFEKATPAAMLTRVGRLGQALVGPRDAVGAVLRNPALRRIQLAGAASVVGNWSYSTALAVFAYRAGGATAVGVLGVVRMLPAAIGAPFMASLGDRFRRERVMLAADVVQAGTMVAIAAVVAADAGEAPVYALAALSSLVATAFRPAQAALLPRLARSPEELTAANVAASTIVSLGSFAGPALAGLMLAFTSVQMVVLFNALTFLWSAALVLGIRAPAVERRPRGSASLLAGSFAGFAAIAEERRVRMLVSLFSAQTLVDGMRPVLVVTAAFSLLGLGDSGVGYLNSALGVGGLLGTLAAVAVMRRGLGTGFAIGLALWGIGLALVGVWPRIGAALLCLAVLGIGNTVIDVSGYTLLQRAAPDEVLARVFGALESVFLGTTMLGALIAPLLVEWLGIRAAIVVAGAFLPVLAVVASRELRALDRELTVPAEQLELLRGSAIFAPLPVHVLEELASALVPLAVEPGDVVIRTGDPGDRFYLVAEGLLDVDVAGTLARGDGFGEIALLRDVPRSATVVAHTSARLYALDRDDFLTVVTGHAESAEAADTVVASRLGAPARAEL